MKIVVIKGRKRDDMVDYATGEIIRDNLPIGYVMEVEGQVPESFIKYVPNKIFDRKKYPELYHLFGKYRLPSQRELDLFIKKHSEWYPKKRKSLFNLFFGWLFK